MRRLITGVDGAGRSCLVDVQEIATTPVGGDRDVRVARVHATEQSPPPAGPPGLGQRHDTELDPGIVRWLVVEHPPRGHEQAAPAPIHHADVLDLVFVIEGSGDLVLHDGAHHVEAGDCVVLPGVDHVLHPDRGGCRLSVISIGTRPPA